MRLLFATAVRRIATGRAATPTDDPEEEIPLTGTHPEQMTTTVRCTSCGTTFTTRSTRPELVVDVCSTCHPAYTGVERSHASGGRIERFERRRALAAR